MYVSKENGLGFHENAFFYKFGLLGSLNRFLNTFLSCYHTKEPYCTIKFIFSTSVFVMTDWEKGIQFAQCWRQTKSKQLIFLNNRQRLKKVIHNSTFDLSTFDHEKSKRRSRNFVCGKNRNSTFRDCFRLTPLSTYKPKSMQRISCFQ